MIRLLLACYPARWRARYGEEFAAILEMRPLGPFDVADVLLGALDARLRLRGLAAPSDAGRAGSMSQRVGGWAAITAGALWLVIFVASGDGSEEDGGALEAIVLLGASLSLLVAVVGLSAFQARRYPRLVWASVVIPALGACVALAGQVLHLFMGDRPIFLEFGPWYVWMAGFMAMTVGSALFGFATWRVRALSRSAAALLVAGGVLLVPAAMGLSELVGLPGGITATGAVAAFSGGWIWTGISALRAGRGVAVAMPAS